MKAIRFKKTGHYVGNHDEATKVLGGAVIYVGRRGENKAIKTYERDNQTLPLQFNDWIMDINGIILVLDDTQYQALIAEKSIAKKQIEPPKDLGQIISDEVEAVINRERLQGGYLAGNKLAKDGYIKPPYITEMENQINALSTIVSALDCRLNVLSGGE